MLPLAALPVLPLPAALQDDDSVIFIENAADDASVYTVNSSSIGTPPNPPCSPFFGNDNDDIHSISSTDSIPALLDNDEPDDEPDRRNRDNAAIEPFVIIGGDYPMPGAFVRLAIPPATAATAAPPNSVTTEDDPEEIPEKPNYPSADILPPSLAFHAHQVATSNNQPSSSSATTNYDADLRHDYDNRFSNMVSCYSTPAVNDDDASITRRIYLNYDSDEARCEQAHREEMYRYNDQYEKEQFEKWKKDNNLSVIVDTSVYAVSQLFATTQDTFTYDPNVFRDASIQPPADTIDPWTTPADSELTPEEEETPVPCSFAGLTAYLSMPYDEYLQKHVYDLFETKVNPDFLSAVPELRDLLYSDLFRDRFAPTKWTGLINVPELDIETTDDLPSSLRAKPRHVNPLLLDPFNKEMDRMTTYMYRKSYSPYSSPLVIAAKATDPYIRIVGDYTRLNPFIKKRQEVIPNVKIELEKARLAKYFIDLDFANSFHQFILSRRSSQLLSVATPRGQLEPIFAPEGASIMTSMLQTVVNEIFSIYSDWMIFIFDNVLILCSDFRDAYNKLVLVLRRAAEYNLVFKMSKCSLGYTHADFFGYHVTNGTYSMGQSRLEGISKIVFPTNIKGMQRFLGATRYVADFIPNYSALSAPLCDMTAKAFDWNPKTWTEDYESTFTKCKEAILQAQTLYLPDYSLQWILRPDASTFAVGAVLVQLKPTEADPTIFQEQILSLTSKKLSPSARNWATIKAEAYAIYFAITSNEYFLRGKFFTVETDHANLVWIEKSVESMIVRWRAILRVYNFRIRHIKGELNVMADMLSRMYHTDHSIELVDNDPSPAVSAVAAEEVPVSLTQEECLIQAHTGARFHRGASATYEALNKYFPGHGIPYALVNDFVKRCGICAKVRTGLQTTLVPITRNLQLPRNKRAVGWDDLTITPVDEYGNSNLSVFVDLTTGQTALYPRKDHSADSLLDNLFVFYATYGKYDEIHTDPGSDICSQAVELLNAWFGVTHQTSLVDVHTSNGVENTNGRILRFLRTLVAEFGIKKKWSKPSILYAIQFHLNDFLNSEFGIRPFDATFGTESGAYFLLPTSMPPHVASNERLKLLNDDLRLVRELSYKHKAKIIESRLPSNPVSQNKFQPGDLVLYHVVKPRVSKLSPVYAGPFEVLSHYQNDVSCRHLVLHYVEKFHVDKLGMFHGTPEDGFKMALLDRDQHVVLLIDAHRGVPSRRTGMEFGTRFADGDYVWLPYSTDIASTEAFEKYCRRLTELQFLLITVKEAQIRVKLLNTNVIPAIPTTEFFLDLRYFGEKYYDDFQDTTADAYSRRYFFLARFGQFQDTRHIKIPVLIPLRKQTVLFNGYAYALYGTQKELPPDGVLVDAEFSKHTPCVLSK